MAGRDRSQPLTSVIRLSRVGKKIAGSVLVMAEDEKTRRLNKKTCVAHALCLIGCVPWITPREVLPAWKAHTHTRTCTRMHEASQHTNSDYTTSFQRQIYTCGPDVPALLWPSLRLVLQFPLRSLTRGLPPKSKTPQKRLVCHVHLVTPPRGPGVYHT